MKLFILSILGHIAENKTIFFLDYLAGSAFHAFFQETKCCCWVCLCVHVCIQEHGQTCSSSSCHWSLFILKRLVDAFWGDSSFCFSRQQFTYISAHTVFSVQYFILMDIKCLFSWISVRWSKSNTSLLLRVQKYCTFFFLILSCVFIFVPRKWKKATCKYALGVGNPHWRVFWNRYSSLHALPAALTPEQILCRDQIS